jgi:REP element-mobilizing transposase RayT
MPQSLANILVHLIFSTKGRAPLIQPGLSPDLNAYLGGILASLECPPVLIGSVVDHVHILCALSRKHALAEVVEDVKKGSSKWVKTKGPGLENFYWQVGYGAFSVSQSNVEAVRAYIADQENHHKRMSFQDEFRAFLKKHGLEYDERYVWD